MKIKNNGETVFARIRNGLYFYLFSIAMMVCMIIFKVVFYFSLQTVNSINPKNKNGALMFEQGTKIRLQQFGFVKTS